MVLARWSPSGELSMIEKQLNKLFGKSFEAWEVNQPITDMYEEDGELRIEVDLPNSKEEEIAISISGQALEIRAEHNEKVEKKERQYRLRESLSDGFRRQVTLPEGAQPDEVTAEFNGGILKISMPATEATGKKIAIASAKLAGGPTAQGP